MSALRECPFCGGVNPGLWHQDIGVKSFPRVNCGACGSGTGLSPKWSDDEAIAAWNRRAGDDDVEKLRAELAAAREALRQALNSRAVDCAEAEHIGWAYRAQAALGDTP